MKTDFSKDNIMSWLSDRTGIDVDVSPNQSGGPAISINGPSQNIRDTTIGRLLRGGAGTLRSVGSSDVGRFVSGAVRGVGGQVGFKNTSLSAEENRVLQGGSQAAAVVVGGYLAAPYIASAYGSASSWVAAHQGISTFGAVSAINSLKGQPKSSDEALRAAAISQGADPSIVNALPTTNFSGYGGHPDTADALQVNNQPGVRPTLSNRTQKMTDAGPTIIQQGSTINPTVLYIGGSLIVGLLLLKKFKVV